MGTSFCVSSTLALAMSAGIGAFTQGPEQNPTSLAHLELTAEAATSTDEGYPSSLRVTLRNVGNLVVTLPVLGGDCHPDNGVKVESFWTSMDEQSGVFGGGACGISDQPSLIERARNAWVRLAPGEFMTTMLHLDPPKKEAGTTEYWVQYTPPDATPREIEELIQAGLVIPTENLATEHRSFMIH